MSRYLYDHEFDALTRAKIFAAIERGVLAGQWFLYSV